ncbi:MAG: metalloregulator ArsR/SmtB family transcription factor [Alphaproteobacteria bacterium]|nr:metalloregulator ArsR/SmtB family transcription factor [Alphaproteobacteria bacterium]
MKDALTPLLAALADPTRRAILARLARGEATVNELAEAFPISQPAVSRHLRILTDAGLVERSVEAQRRPARLVPAAFDPLDRFTGDLRRTFADRYDRLDKVLADMPDTANEKG